jgi:tetratricopeptide (TPR) repeat protein
MIAHTKFLPFAFLVVIASAALTGCSSPNSVRTSSSSTNSDEKTSKPGQIDLETGLELLDRQSDVAAQRTPELVAHHLNEWLDTQDKTGTWEADPLVKRVPSSIKWTPSLTTLDRLQFDANDISFLEGKRLEYGLTRWVVAQQAAGERNPLVPPTNPRLDTDGKSQLQLALTLFDWVIRNVQLEPDRIDPEPEAPKVKVGSEAVAGANLPPSAKGLAGIGYTMTPHRCMYSGKGDAMARAWLFINLCHQQHIEVVLLTVEIEETPRPWCTGAIIGDQLYLFDTRLGIPIPLPKRQGIATLEDVVSDPSILDGLDIDETSRYPVKAAELKTVNATICAAGEQLSRRMSMLEAAAPAKTELIVAVNPNAIASRLKGIKHLGAYAGLWRVPFDSVLYQIARQQRLGPPDTEEASTDVLAFNNDNLSSGRTDHLLGLFTEEGNNLGALKFYLAARLRASESELKGFENSAASEKDVDDTLRRIEANPSTAVGELTGLLKRIFPFEDKEVIPEMVKRLPREKEPLLMALREATKMGAGNVHRMALIARRAKQNANMWIGLMEYDEGKLDIATEWLEKRTLGDTDSSPWLHSARYNLSRTRERQGKLDEAIETLESDVDSPQRQGNVVRARLLRAMKSDGGAS